MGKKNVPCDNFCVEVILALQCTLWTHFNFHLLNALCTHVLCISCTCICYVFVPYALTLPESGLSFMSIKICSVLLFTSFTNHHLFRITILYILRLDYGFCESLHLLYTL